MGTIIKLRCIDQVLALESTPVVASGGLGEDFIEVSFCSKWDGLAKTAVFWRTEAEVYHIPLDESGVCPIPPEVLVDEGAIYFGLFGVSEDGRQRTSEVMRYTITKGAITSGTKPSEPTSDIYTQLLAKYAEVLNGVQEIADAAEASKQAAEASAAAAEAATDIAGQAASTAEQAAGIAGQAVSTAEQATAQLAEHIGDKTNPHGVTAEQVGARPDTWTPTAEDVGARPDTWTPTAEDVGARPDTWTPTAGDVGAYNKTETLADETKTLYGLGADAVPNDVLALAKQLIDSSVTTANAKARVATGSYTGTGSGGYSLTFDFEPKLVFVSCGTLARSEAYSSYFVRGCPYANTIAGNFDSNYTKNEPFLALLSVTWGEKGLSWRNQGSAATGAQLNVSGNVYYYAAIG